MTDFDELAERFQAVDGAPLVDYVGLALPFYLLQINSLLSERRALMPVEEFVLKAVKSGAANISEALGILGLDGPYGRNVVERLICEEFLSGKDSRLSLSPKGELALLEDGQKKTYERVLPLVWDPTSCRLVRIRVDLIRSQEAKAEHLIKVIPPSVRVPPLSEFPLDSALSRVEQGDGDHVVRFLELRRRTLMYRRGLLLLYSSGKGREPFARIALDGVVDGSYGAAFVQQGLLPRLGVDTVFSRRLGSTAVEQRVRAIGTASPDGSLGELLRQRSTLQLGIAGLEKQSDPSAEAKLEEKRNQLADIQIKLASFPIRPMMAFEMPRMVDYALQRAREVVFITTTLPIGNRLTPIRLLLLEQVLRKKNVRVNILMSDRPSPDDLTTGAGAIPLLAKLTDLMRRYENLEVAFLRDTSRVVFEVSFDQVFTAVANDPPLGVRSSEPLARQFSGYALSGKQVVNAYNEQYMDNAALASVERIRVSMPRQKRGA